MTTITIDRALLEQALEALEYNRANWQGKAEAITALRAALAQQAEPVQEPVAVVRWNDIGHISWRALVMLPDGTPLYAAPPKAEPLTEEEIDAMWRNAVSAEGFTTAQFVRNFVRDVERALEEKNRGR